MKPQDTIQFKWISFQEAVDKNREQMSLFNEFLRVIKRLQFLKHLACENTSKKLATILKGIFCKMNIEKIEQIIKLVKEMMLRNLNIKILKMRNRNYFTDRNHLAAHSNQSNQSMNNNDSTASKANDNSDVSTNDYHDIKSPMVGTFFLQDSKELNEPIVNVGDKVNKGDIIGYVEAMKVLNEVNNRCCWRNY